MTVGPPGSQGTSSSSTSTGEPTRTSLSGLGAELGEETDEAHALRERPAVAAVRRGQVVGVRQLGAHSHGYRFLAYAGVSGSVDESLIEQSSDRLSAAADRDDLAVEPGKPRRAPLGCDALWLDSVCHIDRSFGMIMGCGQPHKR